MFYGGNLANLRIMQGMSRKELAYCLNVSEQAIWQYENNYTSPKLQTMNELKKLFHVRTQYFYTKDLLQQKNISNRINVMNIAYRSKMLHVISKTKAEAKHLEFIDLFVDELTANISHPTAKIIQLRDQVIKYLNHTDDCRDVQIEVCAKIARESLEFDDNSNNNLLFLVEKSGIFTFEKALGEEVDAYSLWTEEHRPYIILGNLKRSAVRRNFDIAHELGHLLLHYRLEFCTLDSKEHKAIEKEANAFAGAFLLPKEAFNIDMKTIERLTNPDAYVSLKKKWKVSLQVLGFRAANLGWIDAKEHRNFYAGLHRRRYLELEPLDEELPRQRPMKVKSMIDLVSKKGLMDLSDTFVDRWKVEISFVSHLTGIDQSFLKKYIMTDQLKVSEVTHLSAYQ